MSRERGHQIPRSGSIESSSGWIFGREYANPAVKHLLALPTSRWAIVTARLVLIAGGIAAYGRNRKQLAAQAHV